MAAGTQAEGELPHHAAVTAQLLGRKEVGDYNDPQTFLSLIETSAGVFNYAKYSNPEYDRLMTEAKVLLDLKTRSNLMAQAEKIALDECGVIPIYVTTTKNLVSPRVIGWEDNVENWHRTRFMRLKA